MMYWSLWLEVGLVVCGDVVMIEYVELLLGWVLIISGWILGVIEFGELFVYYLFFIVDFVVLDDVLIYSLWVCQVRFVIYFGDLGCDIVVWVCEILGKVFMLDNVVLFVVLFNQCVIEVVYGL